MDRYPSRRFKKGLSSSLSILVLFTVGYFVEGEINIAIAADDRSKPHKQEDPIAIPGATGATVSKNNTEDITPASSPIEKQKAVVENKTTSSESVKDDDTAVLQDFHATAYCLKGRTASGAPVRQGVIAADPRVLPLGTVVHIKAGRYTGNYTVLDTGGSIKGRKVDIYVPTYQEAKRFGRQRVKVKVISRAK